MRNGLVWSRDGRTLVTAAADGVLKAWDGATGALRSGLDLDAGAAQRIVGTSIGGVATLESPDIADAPAHRAERIRSMAGNSARHIADTPERERTGSTSTRRHEASAGQRRIALDTERSVAYRVTEDTTEGQSNCKAVRAATHVVVRVKNAHAGFLQPRGARLIGRMRRRAFLMHGAAVIGGRSPRPR